MGCEVTILADSVPPNGNRLITFEVEHWRAIHAEVLRHRSFSFSAASSRAIPGGRMVDYVRAKPAGPLIWTTAKKGMQGGKPFKGGDAVLADRTWNDGRLDALIAAENLGHIGVHKSITNRLLEPFAHIRCVITTNEDNLYHFFAQRLHWDAEPSIQQLAKRMAVAYEASTPKVLAPGGWHLPYITREDYDDQQIDGSMPPNPVGAIVRISAARCARVSYKTHEGKRPTRDEDLELYESLVGSEPKHASPTEHQAEAMDDYTGKYLAPAINGNLGAGWRQHRKMIVGERVTAATFDLKARLALYGDRDYLLEEPA